MPRDRAKRLATNHPRRTAPEKHAERRAAYRYAITNLFDATVQSYIEGRIPMRPDHRKARARW